MKLIYNGKVTKRVEPFGELVPDKVFEENREHVIKVLLKVHGVEEVKEPKKKIKKEEVNKEDE